MAGLVKVVDKLPSFSRSAYEVLNDALKEGGRDILINARTRAPYDKGGLRADSIVESVGILKQRVSFWKEYARYQEFGGDSKRRVRHYSTSGTGAHYLKTAGDIQRDKMNAVFKKHAGRARP
jgi:hypothetical protein